MSDEGNCATRQGGKSLPGLYCEICLNTKHQRHILMSLFFLPFLETPCIEKTCPSHGPSATQVKKRERRNGQQNAGKLQFEGKSKEWESSCLLIVQIPLYICRQCNYLRICLLT